MSELFPMMACPCDFRPGDCVRKFVTMSNVTPFCGIVTHLAPAANKVWVQWPVEHSSEDPETLIKVNPVIFGLPTVTKDHGYSSYEKELSEKLYGRIPKTSTDQEKKALRIAHTFATEVVGKLVNDIVDCQKSSLTDAQAYNRIYDKYSDICSDYIMQSSIRKVYATVTKHADCQLCHQSERRDAQHCILDLQKYFDDLPEIRGKIKEIEKILMKKYEITDKDLTDLSIHGDKPTITRK